MAKDGSSSKAAREAGERNLAKWKEKNPSGGNLRHGAYSQEVRRKYSDNRYREAKQLKGVITNLIDDLGGADTLTAAQSLILDNIRSKLIVLFQIGKFVEGQESIINTDGELLPCLGRNYTAYSESLRRDLEALFAIKRKPALQSYENTLRMLEGGKK